MATASWLKTSLAWGSLLDISRPSGLFVMTHVVLDKATEAVGEPAAPSPSVVWLQPR